HHRAERSIRAERERRHRAGGIIRGHQKAAGRIDREMDRVLAARRLAVEEAELAARLVNGEGADIGEIGMDRVEEALPAVEYQEGGVDEIADQLDMLEAAGGGIDAVDIDAIAMGLALLGRDGAEGNRTPDLDSANVALSHLSYGPIFAPGGRTMGIEDRAVKAVQRFSHCLHRARGDATVPARRQPETPADALLRVADRHGDFDLYLDADRLGRDELADRLQCHQQLQPLRRERR